MNAPLAHPRPIAIDFAAMEERARATLANVIATGAAIAQREPWRIIRALRPWGPAMWEEPADLAALLAEAREKIAAQAMAARAGHYAYSDSRLIALRQAEAALVAMMEDRK